MKSILLIIFLGYCFCLDRQWEDPHDMNTNAKQKIEQLGLKDSVFETEGKNKDQAECNCSEKNRIKISDELSYVYLKRIVSLLINSATADVRNVRMRNCKFALDVETESYKFLLEFIVNKEVDTQKLRQLDTILTNLLQRSITDDIYDVVLTTQERFFHLLLDVKTLILIGACIAIYIAYHLSQTQFSFGYIIKYFSLIIWILDYACRYQTLLEVFYLFKLYL